MHSQLLYGIIIWGNTFPTYTRKLTALQNRAVKVISGAHFRNSVKPLYVQYKILQIDDLYKLEVAKMVYCCIHNKAQSSFLNYFNKITGVSQRLTRASSNTDMLYIPLCKSNRLQRCIKYRGVKIWNSIPKEIRDTSHKSFKRRYKNFLLSLYN